MILLAGILVVAASCSKNHSFRAEGTLTGPDMGACVCCGGVILTIDNQVGNYRIDSLPFMTRQHLYSLPFPQRISFDYVPDDTCGTIEYLKVTSFLIGN